MEDREEMATVLQRVHHILRQHLKLDTGFLIKLVAASVLSDEEREDTEEIRNSYKRVDALVDLLKRKPYSSYLSFLTILKKHDEGLYFQCTDEGEFSS